MSPQIEYRMAQLKQADFVHHAEEARRATAASAAQSDAATSQPHPPRSAGQPTSALPVLYVLDGDRRSLDGLLDDLSGRFGRDFTVRGETSPDRALRAVEAMAAAGERLALLLIDDIASECLTRAHALYPRAARVLLVDRDYSAASPAVQAIALGRADFHITRPWTDDESMYRAMTDFLASWEEEQEPNFELFSIVADADDSRAAQLRDVLSRLRMPAGFYETASEAGQQLLERAGVDARRLPVVVRYDGHVLIDPSLPDLARVIGVNVTNDVHDCQVAVIGARPAGLTAAVYAASEGLDTVVLELAVSGGQAGTSPMIRNYPGFPHGISGGQLMQRTCEQAWLMGPHIVFAQQVVGLERRDEHCAVRLLDGSEVRAQTVVIATGVEWRRLGVPSLEALVGAGVFYGAAVGESRAMQDRDVFIVGAGNSAGQAALHLAKHARAVTLVMRGARIEASMSSYLVRAITETPNIDVRSQTEVVDGAGDGHLRSLTLADRARGVTEDVTADALFVMIGGEPHTQWLPEEIARDPQGYVITGRDVRAIDATVAEVLTLETSVPGVFAAGDVRQGSIKRVASAVGEGATVVRLVHERLGAGTPSPSVPRKMSRSLVAPRASSSRASSCGRSRTSATVREAVGHSLIDAPRA
jgi:thioredoxin reductase (NADPH)